MLKIKMISLICILFLSSVTVIADENNSSKKFNRKYYAGLRLGAWANQGESPPGNLVIDDITPSIIINSDINDANFFIEGAFGVKVINPLFAEISFGMVNRGTVEKFQGNIRDLGNLLIYPILVQLKYYPLAGINSKFQPFIGGGGGVYFGKQSIQITNDLNSLYYDINGESETDINYTLVSGFDWIVGEKFSVEFQGKYMPIDYSKYLVTVKDYSAVTITAGIKYRYNSSKQ